ncbi:MAG: hypothetical protein II305_00540, partial [Clostridia bacterium]|nr:hypothetical protein [Clostridia bacterium]
MKKCLEEMLKNLNSVELGENFNLNLQSLAVTSQAKINAKSTKCFFISAVAVILVVTVISLTCFLPMLVGSDRSNDGENNIFANSYYDNYFDDEKNAVYPWEVATQNSGSSLTEAKFAPWKNGALKLTTLTLSGNSTSGILPTSTGVVNPSDILYLTGGAANQIEQSNKKLALLNNSEIRSCINGRWLGIYTEYGSHAGCEGLFYDLQDDDYVCVACKLLELIRTNEYYLDACVRMAVEVYCMKVPTTPAVETSLEKKFPKYYKAFYKSDALKVFASGEKPTQENTKLDFKKGGIYNEKWETTKMDEFKYPVVKVLEYGKDVNKCFFALVSPDDNVAWGSFIYDFSKNKLYSLNGDTEQSGITIVGNENFKYHYGDYYYNYSRSERNELIIMAELAFATNVTVSDDYKYIAVSAPYFAVSAQYDDPETGIKKNVYEEDVVFLVDVENGTCKALYDTKDSDCSFYYEIKDSDGPWPSKAPEFLEGEICFPTKRGSWRFDNKKEIKGELLKIATYNSSKYAIMQCDDDVRIYNLPEAVDVTEEMNNVKFESESYPECQKDYLKLIGNESGSIFNGKYVATASKSGRFVYLYYEYLGQVLCIDTETKESETLMVDKSFVEGAAKVENVKYQIFVSDDGNNLFLTYYNDCRLTFIKDKISFPHVISIWHTGDEYYTCYMIEYDNFEVYFSKDANKTLRLDDENKARFIRCVQILSCDFVMDIIKEFESVNKTSSAERDVLHKRFENGIRGYCEEVAEFAVYNGETVYLPESAVTECLYKS